MKKIMKIILIIHNFINIFCQEISKNNSLKNVLYVFQIYSYKKQNWYLKK